MALHRGSTNRQYFFVCFSALNESEIMASSSYADVFGPGPLTVTQIQSMNFNRLTLEEKIFVRNKGRSTPELALTQEARSKNKVYIRCFDVAKYKEYVWLCGCEITNSLFCFPWKRRKSQQVL